MGCPHPSLLPKLLARPLRPPPLRPHCSHGPYAFYSNRTKSRGLPTRTPMFRPRMTSRCISKAIWSSSSKFPWLPTPVATLLTPDLGLWVSEPVSPGLTEAEPPGQEDGKGPWPPTWPKSHPHEQPVSCLLPLSQSPRPSRPPCLPPAPGREPTFLPAAPHRQGRPGAALP